MGLHFRLGIRPPRLASVLSDVPMEMLGGGCSSSSPSAIWLEGVAELGPVRSVRSGLHFGQASMVSAESLRGPGSREASKAWEHLQSGCILQGMPRHRWFPFGRLRGILLRRSGCCSPLLGAA